MEKPESGKMNTIKDFYNSVYYKNAKAHTSISRHNKNLTKKLSISKNHKILDVACGTGEWLGACSCCGADVSGIDLSDKAIDICHSFIKGGKFFVGVAEQLPFQDDMFDVVTCLGSLEHFIDPVKALKEMVRVAKDDAKFLILVPNLDFLTRKIGLFIGTCQVNAKEEPRTLEAWQELFLEAELVVEKRWKDIHVLAWSWISSSKWYHIPIRFAQAFALVFWPLKWQYQVYHLCVKKIQEGDST